MVGPRPNTLKIARVACTCTCSVHSCTEYQILASVNHRKCKQLGRRGFLLRRGFLRTDAFAPGLGCLGCACLQAHASETRRWCQRCCQSWPSYQRALSKVGLGGFLLKRCLRRTSRSASALRRGLRSLILFPQTKSFATSTCWQMVTTSGPGYSWKSWMPSLRIAPCGMQMDTTPGARSAW